MYWHNWWTIVGIIGIMWQRRDNTFHLEGLNSHSGVEADLLRPVMIFHIAVRVFSMWINPNRTGGFQTPKKTGGNITPPYVGLRNYRANHPEIWHDCRSHLSNGLPDRNIQILDTRIFEKLWDIHISGMSRI